MYIYIYIYEYTYTFIFSLQWIMHVRRLSASNPNGDGILPKNEDVTMTSWLQILESTSKHGKNMEVLNHVKHRDEHQKWKC